MKISKFNKEVTIFFESPTVEKFYGMPVVNKAQVTVLPLKNLAIFSGYNPYSKNDIYLRIPLSEIGIGIELFEQTEIVNNQPHLLILKREAMSKIKNLLLKKAKEILPHPVKGDWVIK